MKKTLALLLALVMSVSLVACGNNGTDATASDGEVVDAATLVSDSFIDPVTEWDQYNTLISEIKSETDYAKRTELMHEAEDILMSNYCVMPIYYYNDIYMQKDYVDGIYANLFQTKFFMYATMSNGADTLNINLASEPDYLDPALNSSVDGACLAANSFSGLYTYDSEGKTVPACATGYTVTDDGLTYTVTLRDGLKWSDGSDLTANDFVYAWKRAVDPATAADYKYMFSGFAGYDEETAGDLQVSAIDNTTLTFTLSSPCAYIEDLMAFPVFYPVCEAYVEANTTDGEPGSWCTEAGFVSNGAYTCTAWEHDTSMTYTKNPYWYDADKVTVNTLQFMLSAEDTAIYAAYNAGNLDFADTVPTDEIAGLIADSNPEFHCIDALGTYYVAFNCKSELFADKTPEQAACMRKAFTILIDRDYICENIGQTGQVAANSFIPLGMADGNGGTFKTDAAEGYFEQYGIRDNYDATVEEARTLLRAAGYKFNDDGTLSDETPISIEYLTNNGTGHVAVAEAIQQDLSVVGINLTIQSEDWNVFLEDRKGGNYDIAREGWIADFNDPINMLEMWITTSGNNDCQFGR